MVRYCGSWLITHDGKHYDWFGCLFCFLINPTTYQDILRVTFGTPTMAPTSIRIHHLVIVGDSLCTYAVDNITWSLLSIVLKAATRLETAETMTFAKVSNLDQKGIRSTNCAI